MDKDEIQKKIAELESIMAQYKNELSVFEKEIFKVISEYQNALKEEKIKEIKQNLNI
jgi:oligoendopeptidase F